MQHFYSLFTTALFLSTTIAADVGLYDISDSAHPKLLNIDIKEAWITSRSNDNTEYYLDLRTTNTLPVSTDKIVLMVGDKTIPFNSSGSEDYGRIHILGTTITNLSLISGIAQHFHATVVGHHHPGHQMLVQIIPDKDEFSKGEPVIVKLRITNIGTNTFAYMQGGSQRGPRDNQFAFTAMGPDLKMLPDVGDPRNFGGLASTITLKPGQSHELPVDLTKWFSFDKSGEYYLRGSYAMSFQDLDSPISHDIWDDFACAAFRITVK